MKFLKSWKFISLMLLGILLILLPLFLPRYWVNLFSEMLIISIFALGVNILQGYMGLASLGQSAYFGVGAYLVAFLTTKFIFTPVGIANFLLVLLAGVVLIGIVSAIFGLLTLRTSGMIFLMLTLALGQVLYGLAIRWSSFTNSTDGISGIPRPSLGLPMSMENATSFYFFVLFFALICGFLIYRIIHSPFGSALVGIRTNEVRMQTLGYNTWLYKYLGFIIAGTFAGFAGILYAYFNGFVAPSELSVGWSALGLFAGIVGGTQLFSGPILGVWILTLSKAISSAYTRHWPLVFGLIFIVVILCARQGIGTYFLERGRKIGWFKG